MVTKALLLGIYESSLLAKAGILPVDGWNAIASSYTEPEVISLFTDLSKDAQAGTPSFGPFERCEAMQDDVAIPRYFAEVAANTTMHDQIWSDMAVAYLLKKRLEKADVTDADVSLGSYLLSYADGTLGDAFRTELESWSNSERWKFPAKPEAADFPEEWWNVFTIDGGDLRFPRTILFILKSAFQAGALEPLIPEAVTHWTRFSQAADQVYL